MPVLLTEKMHISLSVYSLLVVSFSTTQVLRPKISLLPEKGKGNLLLKVHNPNQKNICVAYLKFYYAFLKMRYHISLHRADLENHALKRFQNIQP